MPEDTADYIAIKDYSKYNLIEPVVKPFNMTLEEVSAELHKMTSRKREFMIKVMHIIATSSYLANVMKGEMPLGVKKMLEMAENLSADYG